MLVPRSHGLVVRMLASVGKNYSVIFKLFLVFFPLWHKVAKKDLKLTKQKMLGVTALD